MFKLNLFELIHDVDRSWLPFFEKEKNKPYFKGLLNNLETSYNEEIVYPPYNLIFSAFKYCSLTDLKVIIIGQDPYHQKDQADGLAFSVYPSKKITPSLQNIFKELKASVGVDNKNLSLKKWAEQGILLLNTILTVVDSKPLSHSEIGWSVFINNVLNMINELKTDLIFVAWGKKAQNMIFFRNLKKGTIVLKSGHPSPLSVKYFLGCNHFSLINQILIKKKLKPINWKT